jgi:predicted dehydrogenase
VDAVSVAVPPDVQVDIAVRAATAGKHLVLEKPLAFSTAAADRVVEAVQSSGVRSVVFHTARFRPEVAAWISAVRGAGDWHGAAVTLLASLFDSAGPFPPSPWRREKGALWDVGPHALAMILATLGPVGEIAATAGRGDTVHLVLRHAPEASSTLSLSLTIPAAAATSSWSVYGPRGISHMPDGPTTPVEAFGHAVTALLRPTPADADAPASDVHHAREIVRILEAAEAALSHH